MQNRKTMKNTLKFVAVLVEIIAIGWWIADQAVKRATHVSQPVTHVVEVASAHSELFTNDIANDTQVSVPSTNLAGPVVTNNTLVIAFKGFTFGGIK